MVITSKYNGHCKVCGVAIKIGQRINWTRTDGASCLDRTACLKRFKAAQAAPPETDDCPPDFAADVEPEMVPAGANEEPPF